MHCIGSADWQLARSFIASALLDPMLLPISALLAMLTHRFDKGMGGWNVMRELGLLELQPLGLDHWT